MRRILVDTDVLIEILRGSEWAVACVSELHRTGVQFLFSPVTRAEIVHGMRPGEERQINLLLSAMEPLPITDTAGDRAGGYLRAFHRSHGVQMGDALIAASAVLARAALLTCNRKHYPMPDIAVIVPDRPSPAVRRPSRSRSGG